MGKIKLLSQNLINLIAAGEVVERPASALKELLENSVDAQSTEIIVTLEDYGIKLIKVKDNGIGMEKEDAMLAFKQHATSKLSSEDDLSNINTLGFRGEALASISSVADYINLITKAENSKPVNIRIEKDEFKEMPSVQTDRGTTIEIYNIFQKIPARKKFLKSPATELKYLTNAFIDVALTNTAIHFELWHNSKLIYRLTKTNNIKDRIFEIFGAGVAKELFPEANFENNTYQIHALLSDPKSAKKTSGHQFVYVNNRFITSKIISAAVNEAFKGFIHRDLKASYFIFIHTSPQSLDVNIHPRKLEVKFENNEEVFRIIYNLGKKTLEKETKQIVTENLAPVESYEPKSISNFDTTLKPKVDHSNSKFSSKSDFKVPAALSFTEALLKDTSNVQRITQNVERSTHNFFNPGESIFQIFNTYIVIDRGSKLIMVDQHAAAEKILFEKLLESLNKVTKRPLLVPQLIEVDNSEKDKVLGYKEMFSEIGFSIDDFGHNTIQISEVPEILTNFDIENFIRMILSPDDDILTGFEGLFETYNGIKLTKELYTLIATTACHGAIRAGQRLSLTEMQNLIKDLQNINNPYNCPHGRPTLWELDKYEIEKHFKRKIV